MQVFLIGDMNFGDVQEGLGIQFPDLRITNNFEEVNAMAKLGELDTLVVGGTIWNHPDPWPEVPFSWSNTVPEQVAADIHKVSPSTRILVWCHRPQLYREPVQGVTYLNCFSFGSIYPATASFLAGALSDEEVRTGTF